MRKIRKFSVNESALVLSPEEMRRISGGSGDDGCHQDGCTVSGVTTDGKPVTLDGSCIYAGYYGGSNGYSLVCACDVPNYGVFYADGECDA